MAPSAAQIKPMTTFRVPKRAYRPSFRPSENQAVWRTACEHASGPAGDQAVWGTAKSRASQNTTCEHASGPEENSQAFFRRRGPRHPPNGVVPNWSQKKAGDRVKPLGPVYQTILQTAWFREHVSEPEACSQAFFRRRGPRRLPNGLVPAGAKRRPTFPGAARSHKPSFGPAGNQAVWRTDCELASDPTGDQAVWRTAWSPARPK